MFPPWFTTQASRVPAIAISVTPPPVLVESAPQVAGPLASAAEPVSTFQTTTFVQPPPLPSTA